MNSNTLIDVDVTPALAESQALDVREPNSTPALEELKTYKQWVAWLYDGDNKIPIDPHTDRYASHSNSDTWGSYEQALATAKRRNLHNKGTWNLGFNFSDDDPFTGWDTDDCYDPETGELAPEARLIVGHTKTYAEVSPSGQGVKGISRANLPRNLTTGGLEIYSKDRFFTITGNHLPGTPDTITDGQKALDYLCGRYGGKSQGVTAEAPRKKLGEGEGRNNALRDEAGRLRRAGYSVDEIRDMLRALNPHFCDPLLSEDEIENTILKSAAKWKQGNVKAEPQPRRFTFLTYENLINRPDPIFLVNDFLIQDSLTAIVAPYSSYKSFVAVGIAAAVATGQGWAGRKTRHARAVYISAEGSAGIKRRVQAWGIENDANPDNLFIVPEAPNLLEPSDVDALLADMPNEPGLIVIDTLARCMVGGDENSAKDMGRFIQGCDQLRTATGATVLILHHVNKQKGGIRGSTALPGALDTIILAERQNGPIHGSQGVNGLMLVCEKQKDYAEFDPLYFSTAVVPLPSGETSLVLQPTTDFRMDLRTKSLTAKQTAILNALLAFGPDGTTPAEWLQAAGVAKATFYRVKNELVARGLVLAGDGERFVWNGGQG